MSLKNLGKKVEISKKLHSMLDSVNPMYFPKQLIKSIPNSIMEDADDQTEVYDIFLVSKDFTI
jgi:hypothetical protein